ncbi:MAG: cation transporter [Anaerococcus sp.]|nr:cation transporter [Anaerococcus sp.]
MKKANIKLEDLACPSCAIKIESAVKGVDGVEDDSVKVLFNASKVKVNFDEDKTDIKEIEDSIQKIGYQVKKSTLR